MTNYKTPPMPKNLGEVELSENALNVFKKRYQRKDTQGNIIETKEQTFWRVAHYIATVEESYQGDVEQKAKEFYELLASRNFFPNSPTFTGAGTPIGQLAACFVLPITDDMGGDPSGIFQSLRDAALIQQTGGGNGFSFSRLRPKNTVVKSSKGNASGPIGFLSVYDKAFDEIAQGGTRRGANMAVLRVDHPDIEEFISCKTSENAITNFNISVGITDAFMQAVKEDADWDLKFIDVANEKTKGFLGTIDEAQAQGLPIRIYKTVKARKLFEKIVKQAHHNGEPGLLFLDKANATNPLKHLYSLEATNPCGEQWLGPYENCCLGSINLAQHIKENGQVDWEKLEKSIALSVNFLDNVVDINGYVPAVPRLREAALNARRIGLGFMGLADLLYQVGVRYGSKEGQELAAQITEFVRYHAMKKSVELAKSRGTFPAIVGSIFDSQKKMEWQPPKPLFAYKHDFNRPELNWTELKNQIKENGIRNAAQTTIAPTGTIGTVSGVEGYGCEPVFALAYIRHFNDNGKDVELTYTSPLFLKKLESEIEDQELRNQIIRKVAQKGNCQDIEGLSDEIGRVFVVSSDISAQEHIEMQAAMQAFIDNSISKTINFPQGTFEEEVAEAYMLAWELNCKGITVYVTGSRESVVLETADTANKKLEPSENEKIFIWNDSRKPRPKHLKGDTFEIDTPVGKAFVTINYNGGGQPFEVFLNTAKAGSETAAVSEAIGRLISLNLRIASPVEPRERLETIKNQLTGIGGGRSMGFGQYRVRSLPDGVAKILEQYLDETSSVAQTSNQKSEMPEYPPVANQLRGDLCPECGQASVINEEGCAKCYSCGHSEC